MVGFVDIEFVNLNFFDCESEGIGDDEGDVLVEEYED